MRKSQELSSQLFILRDDHEAEPTSTRPISCINVGVFPLDCTSVLGVPGTGSFPQLKTLTFELYLRILSDSLKRYLNIALVM